jgi:ElaB/YqjD/DUF883 family membrane-anchored ribosome-binding protein
MILTAHPSAYEQKRDLHVGGLGRHAIPTLAAVADPVHEVADSWLEKAKDAAEVADDMVRDNPWAAVAVVGALGLALGWFLAQRD